MRTELEYLLGPRGPLAQAWSRYEARPGQLTMALEVARAFEENDVALVEAETGTGKTLAYLLPALMSGRRTVVSTGLKNLQDQIYDHDIPFIRKYFGDNFRYARLKGRENYLCWHYFRRVLAQPSLFPDHTATIKDLADWAGGTQTGDRAEFEFPGLEEGAGLWPEISAPSERCLGQRCPDFRDCFLWRARREAAGADLILVNHHLFMADLALRHGGFGEVLPEWEAAIFDEAHLLEEAATNYFGRTISHGGLAALIRNLDTWPERLQAPLKPCLTALTNQLEALKKFKTAPGESELWLDDDPEAGSLRDLLLNLDTDLRVLARLFPKEADDDRILSLRSRIVEAADTLLFIAEAADSDFVYQAERQGRHLSLSAFPIRVSGPLARNLTQSGLPLVFTSATIALGGDFSHFKERLGLWPEVDGLSLPSPFDYRNRTLCYLPTHLPRPDDPSFIDQAVQEMERLLQLSQGRALILFTSYHHLQRAAQMLKPKIPWTLMLQGQMSRIKILEAFKEDTHSVLLATHSFWQGVDVPGESLSSVIIEKLPFPRPDRPLIRARSRRMAEEGRDAFMDYQVPETALTLKQGLGRLMRSVSDQGLLAILDTRLSKKGYGKKILPALPPSPRTDSLKTVADFFQKINAEL